MCFFYIIQKLRVWSNLKMEIFYIILNICTIQWCLFFLLRVLILKFEEN